MFQSIARRATLALTLCLLAGSPVYVHAQTADPGAVTGGDPQPTGEPRPIPKAMSTMTSIMTVLYALHLA